MFHPYVGTLRLIISSVSKCVCMYVCTYAYIFHPHVYIQTHAYIAHTHTQNTHILTFYPRSPPRPQGSNFPHTHTHTHTQTNKQTCTQKHTCILTFYPRSPPSPHGSNFPQAPVRGKSRQFSALQR